MASGKVSAHASCSGASRDSSPVNVGAYILCAFFNLVLPRLVDGNLDQELYCLMHTALLSSLTENRLIYVMHKDPDLETNIWQTSQVRVSMTL